MPKSPRPAHSYRGARKNAARSYKQEIGVTPITYQESGGKALNANIYAPNGARERNRRKASVRGRVMTAALVIVLILSGCILLPLPRGGRLD